VRQLKLLALAFAVVLGCHCVEAQAPAKTSGDIDNGKHLFASAGCATCHGAKAEGTNLAPAIAPPPVDLPGLIAYARKPTGKMPPVPIGTADDQQIGDIYAFLKSIAPASSSAVESLKGDPENGKKLFAAYGCYECHGRQGAGAAIAPRVGPPALSLAGVVRYVRAPTGQMPPYTAKVVSDQDLADIYAYLKSFPAPQPASTIPLLNQQRAPRPAESSFFFACSELVPQYSGSVRRRA